MIVNWEPESLFNLLVLNLQMCWRVQLWTSPELYFLLTPQSHRVSTITTPTFSEAWAMYFQCCMLRILFIRSIRQVSITPFFIMIVQMFVLEMPICHLWQNRILSYLSASQFREIYYTPEGFWISMWTNIRIVCLERRTTTCSKVVLSPMESFFL